MSEKTKGLRSYWDGRRMLSKQGIQIQTPSHFVDGFPSIPLDGELLVDQGAVEELVSKSKEADWAGVKYVIADLPGSPAEFESRLGEMKKLSLPPHVEIADFQQCLGTNQMEDYLQTVLDRGGEGVMLRDPISGYTPGRTSTLRKATVR